MSKQNFHYIYMSNSYNDFSQDKKCLREKWSFEMRRWKHQGLMSRLSITSRNKDWLIEKRHKSW